MFILLVFIGLLCIILGVYTDKHKITDVVLETLSKSNNTKEINELKLRIAIIESTLFYDVGDNEGEEIVEFFDSSNRVDETTTYENVAKSVATKVLHDNIDLVTNTSEKFKLLCQYEEKNLSTEEICSLLDMKKGEVLLLKNLYKNSIL